MSQKKVLVIEDEARMRDSIATILKMEGYETHEAFDGKLGLQKAREILPDLILCDVSMPNMNGHETLEELKKEPTTARIPFIFLTARGEKREVRDGMNHGADDYLVKPFEATDLLAAIESRLKRKSELTGSDEDREVSPEMLIPLGLTEREAETLFWLAQGKSNSDLCIILDVKLTTIKKHLERIFQKLSVENRTAAAAMALEALNAKR